MSRTFTVALVGADGAGKSTIARRLPGLLPFPASYLYMGVASASSNHALPTTRLAHAVRAALGRREDHGPPAVPETASVADPAHADLTSRAGRAGGSGSSVRAVLRLANRLAEEWYRQGLVWAERARGRVVVFDRHFYLDFYGHDIAPAGGPARRWTDRLHGRLLERLYPRPDLVIHLDAPPEVLLARKGEGTLEALARRNAEYVAVRPRLREVVVVDASRPIEAVEADVLGHVLAFARRRGIAGAGEAGDR